MPKKNLKLKSPLLCLLLLCSLLLSGCAEKVKLSEKTVRTDVKTLKAVVTAEDLGKLDGFDQLASADFSGSTCFEELVEWGEDHPLTELRFTVPLPDGREVENTVTELDLTGMTEPDAEEMLWKLAYLPQLQSVNLGSEEEGLPPELAVQFMDRYPDLEFQYSCTLLGKESCLDEKELDLTKTAPKEIERALTTVSCLRNLRTIRLGDDTREDAPSWELIRKLREAAPDAAIRYRFSLYGKDFSLEDRTVDLSYTEVTDNGDAVLAAALCMPKLETLDMDSCGLSNERLAEIRDALPDTEVIWRVFFGARYTLRTNAIKVLASAPSYGGVLYNKDLEVFKYCTKLKYVDIGHNETITDLSFVRWLPDLEVLIIAMNPLGDLTPLADCENLEYLELFYSKTDDLSPLAGLKNLKHLNVGHCPQLKDISSIYDLELERFYLGLYISCPVPEEQVQHYRELHPDCDVDNSFWESSEGRWRRAACLEGEELEWYKQQPYYREEWKDFAPRYALLREQFGYDTLDYAVNWKDPTWRRVPWQPQ